jgi:hypothetical protein
MAYDTVIQQGSFTSDGTTKLLSIRSDVDWMYVYNYTNAGVTDDNSVEFYWQRGMAPLAGVRKFKSAGGNTLNETVMTTTGFTLVDTSTNPLTARVAITAGTNITRPVYSTGSTAGLVEGSVVLLTNLTGQQDLSGIEFQVGTIVTDTSFKLSYALANAPGAAATAGFWRKVKWDPIFYPRRRFVANISQAVAAVVTCTVDHGLTVGQKVRMVVPAVYGMVQMDGLQATITAVTANTFTTNIDSSAFTAFVFPLPASVPFSPSLVVPFGEDTAQALSSGANILADATINEAVIGMLLPGGEDAPGGAAENVMYWRAGKSFSVTNV